MFNEFELTFSEGCSDYIKKVYPKQRVILEYGSGGSTMIAAKAGVKIITTETDPKWLIELMGAYKEKGHCGDIIPILADIGATKAWGYPVDESAMQQWPNYSTKAWQFCQEHNLQPDLILIDGRFRVASFLTACINVTKTTILLFDDYVEREYYHSVEELFKPIEIIDNRMAIFKIRPKQVSSQHLLNNMHFFLDPR